MSEAAELPEGDLLLNLRVTVQCITQFVPGVWGSYVQADVRGQTCFILHFQDAGGLVPEVVGWCNGVSSVNGSRCGSRSSQLLC